MCSDHSSLFSFFFFNDTATTEIYTLSLHDALPISQRRPERAGQPESHRAGLAVDDDGGRPRRRQQRRGRVRVGRSEEHTSELQSRQYLVCRLLLEKKKQNQNSSLLPSTY